MTKTKNDWSYLDLQIKTASLYFSRRESYFSKLSVLPNAAALILSTSILSSLAAQNGLISLVAQIVSVACLVLTFCLDPFNKKSLFSNLSKRMFRLEKKFLCAEQKDDTFKDLETKLITIQNKSPDSIKVLHWMCFNRALIEQGRHDFRIDISFPQIFLATWFSIDYKAERLDEQYIKKFREYIE